MSPRLSTAALAPLALAAVALTVPTFPGAASACGGESDPDAYAAFREPVEAALESARFARIRVALAERFETLPETDAWKEAFVANPDAQTWDQVKEEVLAEIATLNSESDFDTVYELPPNTVFSTHVFGLPCEVTLTPGGTVVDVHVELDEG